MRLNIIVPFRTDKKIFNALIPFARQYNYDLNSIQIFTNLDPKAKGRNIEYSLILANSNSWKSGTIFKGGNKIVIGPVAKGTKGINIVYLPELVESEEILLNRYYFYDDNFITAKEADYTAENLASLISIVIQLNNGEPVKK